MRKRIGHQEEFRGPDNLTAKNLTGNPLMESDGRCFPKRFPEQLPQSYGSNRFQITLWTGSSTLPRLHQIGAFWSIERGVKPGPHRPDKSSRLSEQSKVTHSVTREICSCRSLQLTSLWCGTESSLHHTLYIILMCHGRFNNIFRQSVIILDRG